MGQALAKALPTPTKLKLTYFDIEGVGEKVRLALTMGGIPFEDVRVKFEEWGAMKPTTPYGQLPLMSVDDGPPMAQSDAMLRYAGTLATQRGVPLYPPEKMLEIEEGLGLVADMLRDQRIALYIGINPSAFGYDDDFKGSDEHKALVKKLRLAYMEDTLPRYMEYLKARFEKHDWLVPGTTGPTIADCMLIPVLRRLASGGVDHFDRGCVKAHPAVQAYVDRFHAVPAVAQWYAR